MSATKESGHCHPNWRLTSGVVLVINMYGCASGISPQPPDIPTRKQVRDSVADLGLTRTLSGADTAKAGYLMVEQQCNKFFGNVYRWSNDTNFNRKEITLGGAAAAGVLVAFGVSAHAIALTAIGFALTADSMDVFQNFPLFTTNPHAVAKLVDDTMKAYETAAPPDNQKLMVDHQTAITYVSGYAQLCTDRKIQDFVAQALANATPADVNNSSTSIFSAAERILLGYINQDLGLPPSSLNDEQYAQLYWYLKEKAILMTIIVRECLILSPPSRLNRGTPRITSSLLQHNGPC
jgi:hypothetical protein